jgi:aspartyl-tRNA(Asn)/glutamyl-tRNA(Gln) amidotransferase subunit A
MMSGDRDLTVADAARLLRTGKLTPRELAERCIRRIQDHNVALNAMATVTVARALEDADRATRELAAGHDRGPLHGIPVSLKDNIDTAGIRTTSGSRLFADREPEIDSTVAARLREAGAVLMGKANMHELALGIETSNAIFGATRNPWAHDHIPGGSSGGSAAAVASGMCLASIGTDSGGSVRIPAALCGVVGLKPTYGRVSNAGILPNYPSYDCAGPIARTAEDCALVLGAIAGYDPSDFATVRTPVDDYAAQLGAGVSGLRIGVPREHFYTTASDEVRASVEAALVVFARLGATVADVVVPGLDAGWAKAVARPELGQRHADAVASRPQDFDPIVLRKLRDAMNTDLREHLRARRESERVAEDLRRALQSVDVLLVPTTPIAATRIGVATVTYGGREVEVEDALVAFTRVFNLLRVPAISVPCGFTASGLPTGLQLIGRPFDETLLLRAAHAYQAETGGPTQRPVVQAAAEPDWTHAAH